MLNVVVSGINAPRGFQFRAMNLICVCGPHKMVKYTLTTLFGDKHFVLLALLAIIVVIGELNHFFGGSEAIF